MEDPADEKSQRNTDRLQQNWATSHPRGIETTQNENERVVTAALLKKNKLLNSETLKHVGRNCQFYLLLLEERNKIKITEIAPCERVFQKEMLYIR